MSTMPTRLDKYELVTRLGHGGVAEVWKAFDTQLQRYVAIKLLHSNLRDDPLFLERFKREAQLIASLHHPNIVQLHDFQIFQSGSADSHDETTIAYMVMDYIEGYTLADYIRNAADKHKIPMPRAIIGIFTAISQAIDYAHSQQMIHRDIKPANILLDQRNTSRTPMGEPVLTDFGIAKMLGASATMQTGLQMGTAAYISPEQAMGNPGDERSDLYSLGVILYEMVTGGVLPFRGETATEIMAQHINTVPTAPSRFNPRIPPSLEQVIWRSLEKNPAERYPSASAMTRAVAASLMLPIPEALGPLDTVDEDERNMLTVISAGWPAIVATRPTPPPQAARPTPLPPAVGETPVLRPVSTSTPGPVAAGPLISSQGASYGPVNNAASSVEDMQTVLKPVSEIRQPLPPATPRRPRLLIALLSALLVLIVVAGLGIFVFVPRLASPASSIVGHAFYVSSGELNPDTAQGIADQMQIDLQNVPAPPAGKSYRVWLLGDKVLVGGKDLLGPPPVHPPLLLTSNLPVQNGSVHYFYPGDAQHDNLLSATSRLLITEEPTGDATTAPPTDHATWRYFAMIPQNPIPNDPTHLNALNHIRHLFYNESGLAVLGLPGGLDFWLTKNTEKILEWSVGARDDWHGATTSAGNIALMQQLFFSSLQYLDGNPNVHVDMPTVQSSQLTDPIAKVALITVDPLRQNADLSTNPPGYIDHIQLHVAQVAAATDITPATRQLTSQILTAVKNAGTRLTNVHKDIVQLIRIEDNPALMRQPSTGLLLDDLVTQATYAYTGQVDPATNQTTPGVIQAHYEIEKLATFDISTDLPSTL